MKSTFYQKFKVKSFSQKHNTSFLSRISSGTFLFYSDNRINSISKDPKSVNETTPNLDL